MPEAEETVVLRFTHTPQEVIPTEAPSVYSAPMAFGGPVGLDTLIGHALTHNREVQAARYHAQALGARVSQVESLPDPTLMTTSFLEAIQTAAGPQQVALSLSQKFPWFGKRSLRGEAAQYDAAAAYRRLAARELAVIELVKHAYHDLYFAQVAIEETQRLEQPLAEVLEVSKTRYETGSGDVGLESVYQAQIERAKLRTELVALEEAERQARARLAGILHLAPTTRIEALPPIENANVEGEVATLVALAESSQPAYDAWRSEIARDRAAVALAEKEYWPDVTASVNWYEMGDSGLSPVADGRDAVAIGVGVNLPIYRDRLDGAVREAKNRLCETTRRYQAARDQFQVEIETLHATYREHARTLQILETEILPLAEQTLQLTVASYRADRAEFQQLIDVYRTLLRHRVDRHRQVAQREKAIASLERAVGCAVTSPHRVPDAGTETP